MLTLVILGLHSVRVRAEKRHFFPKDQKIPTGFSLRFSRPVLLQDYFGTIWDTISSTTNKTVQIEIGLSGNGGNP